MNAMKTSLACLLLGAALLAPPLHAATPEESFRKSYPGMRIDAIGPTAVTGLYEVVSGSRILYYAPGSEYLLYGPMVTREGKNLTEERIREIMARGLKTLPLEKALRIGSGPRQVIEITDPDCPYCRRASAFLAGKKDLTRHIFFLPLPMHPNAEAKVRQIFCAEDRGRAYEEAMSGKLDDMKFTPCKSPAADELIRVHKEICNRLGITGTPLFMIDGEIVWGADIPRMEQLLGIKK
jgi:thiol:disulfide interchange protein DsbC